MTSTTLTTMSTWLVLALRFGLAGLLIVAGAMKMRAPGDFSTEIANYQLFSSISPYLAAVLPAVEIVLGVGLVALPRAWRQAAELGTFMLVVLFAFAVGSAYFRDLNIDCGCFGVGGGPISHVTLLRNLVLIAAAATLLRLDGPSRWASTPPGPPPHKPRG